jgi:hypothetical protein
MQSAVVPGAVPGAPPSGSDSLHAKCSPSAAGRWVRCPGSVQMAAQFPSADSEASREGTASHYVGSTRLEGYETPAVGSRDPKGTVITIEMIEGANEYFEAVKAVVLSDPARPALTVEQPVNAFSIHPHACWGTPDLWHRLNGNEIHVWDYKFGFGIVEPFENWQLITYASGIMDHLKIDGIADQNTWIVLHIVQPRAPHVLGSHRQWRVRACDLRPYINQLAHAAATACEPNPPVQSGDHCKYCDARHACPAAQRAALFAIDYADTARVEVLTPEALAMELRTMQRAANAIKYRLTALEATAISTLQAGGTVPGFGLQRGQGRAAWTKPVGEVFALGDLMGVDLRAPAEAITPAAARKKLPAELIAAYSAAPESGMKLVPVDNTQAAMIFKSAAGGGV